MASLAMGCESTFLKDLDRGRRRRSRGRTACSASLGMITSSRPWNRTLLRTGINTDTNANANAIRNNPPVDFGSRKHEALKTRHPDKKNRDPIDSPDRLDEWICGNITEIVKNIREAPFLVHVYLDRGEVSSVRLQREKATEDDWPRINRRWEEEENGNQTPEGVILVKELDYSDRRHCDGDEQEVQSPAEKDGCALWGILIQGRGLDRSSCYILETTRVRSSIGSCTHYCLVRAKCFCGKSPETQLRDSWRVKQYTSD